MSDKERNELQSGKLEALDDDNAIVVRKTRNVARRKALLDWTQIATNILLPVTILITVYGLYWQNQIERKSASQRQVEIFYSSELMSAQSVLFSLWTEADPSALDEPLPRDVVDQFVETSIGMSSMNRASVDTAIIALTTFFDRTQACIESVRCDEAELQIQLGVYARDLHCLYVGQINRIGSRFGASRLGDGLKSFVTKNGGCAT